MGRLFVDCFALVAWVLGVGLGGLVAGLRRVAGAVARMLCCGINVLQGGSRTAVVPAAHVSRTS